MYSNTHISQEELELRSWIESLDIKIEKYTSNKKTGKSLEIDIYISELRIGIEYCEIYLHGEKSDKDKKYHKNKLDLAISEKIQLITIFSNEWIERKNQVKSFLKSKLNKNEITLFGRKTKLQEIHKRVAFKFLDDHHIQGSSTVMISYGLFHNDELIAVITGSEHHRNSKLFTLNRLCFKENVSITGGSSKLNKALCQWAKDHGYDTIITWSDNRWSQGNVYKSMGYLKDEDLPPDYFYNDFGTIRAKQSCKKKALLKRGAVGNTEKEMAISLGYDRIWDCGKIRWIMFL